MDVLNIILTIGGPTVLIALMIAHRIGKSQGAAWADEVKTVARGLAKLNGYEYEDAWAEGLKDLRKGVTKWTGSGSGSGSSKSGSKSQSG